MNLVALAVLMHTNAFGYSTLLIARNKEKYSALISALSLILNIGFALLLVKVFHVSYALAILSIMVTYLFHTLASTFLGSKIMGQYSLKRVLADTFPLRLFIPYLTAVLLSVYELERLIFLSLLVYVLLNTKEILLIFSYAKRIVSNQNSTDL